MSEATERERPAPADGAPPTSEQVIAGGGDPMAEEYAAYRLNLAHAAHFLDITETTLKRWLVQDPGLPVLRRGGNGKAYVFWAPDLAAWSKSRDERQQVSEAERRDEVSQLRMDLLGGVVTRETEQAPLSGKERKEELAAEALAIQIAKARSELVEADAMREAIEAAFLKFRNGMLALPDRIARELDLDREGRQAVDRHCRLVLKTLSRELVATDGIQLEAAE